MHILESSVHNIQEMRWLTDWLKRLKYKDGQKAHCDGHFGQAVRERRERVDGQ